MLFRIPDSEKKENFEITFDKIAKKNRDDYLFIKVGQDSELERETAKYLGFSPEKYPTILIIDGARNKKFLYPGTLAKMTDKHLMKFLIAFDDDKLRPYYRSAPIPDQEENDKKLVKTVVANSRFHTILNNTSDVLVFYFIDWNE